MNLFLALLSTIFLMPLAATANSPCERFLTAHLRLLEAGKEWIEIRDLEKMLKSQNYFALNAGHSPSEREVIRSALARMKKLYDTLSIEDREYLDLRFSKVLRDVVENAQDQSVASRRAEDLRDQALGKKVRTIGRGIFKAAISHDGHLLATASIRGSVSVQSTESGQEIFSYQYAAASRGDLIGHVRFTSDDSYLVFSFDNKMMGYVDLTNFKLSLYETHSLDEAFARNSTRTLTHRNHYILADEGYLKAVDVTGERHDIILLPLPNGLWDMSVSDDGRWMVTRHEENEVKLLDLDQFF